MTFVSEKQRRWFFANYGRYGVNPQTNYYSGSTGWIWINNLNAQEGTTIGTNISDSDWISAIQNYQNDLENLPPWIRWLADIKTTLILGTILTFLLSMGGSITSGALMQGFKTELLNLFRSPQR